MPSVTKPICATDEYATSFFRSFCTAETIAPYRMATTDSRMSSGSQAWTPNGKSGSPNRRKP